MFSVYFDMCVLDYNNRMDMIGYHGDEYLLVNMGYYLLASIGYFSFNIGYHGDEYFLVTMVNGIVVGYFYNILVLSSGCYGDEYLHFFLILG